jgi:hypothetical protein
LAIDLEFRRRAVASFIDETPTARWTFSGVKNPRQIAGAIARVVSLRLWLALGVHEGCKSVNEIK